MRRAECFGKMKFKLKKRKRGIKDVVEQEVVFGVGGGREEGGDR